MRRFRTNLTALLAQAWQSGAISLPEDRMSNAAFAGLIARLRSREWVVYAKPPFAGAPCVLRYLAGYTHRIAISNRRIEAFDGHSVTFRYRDSACANRQRTMTLQTDEFLRRFLLHVLPSHLVRIRYYGFLANRIRAASIARARSLIGPGSSATPLVTAALSEPAPQICPRCGIGLLRPAGTVDPSTAFEDSMIILTLGRLTSPPPRAASAQPVPRPHPSRRASCLQCFATRCEPQSRQAIDRPGASSPTLRLHAAPTPGFERQSMPIQPAAAQFN